MEEPGPGPGSGASSVGSLSRAETPTVPRSPGGSVHAVDLAASVADAPEATAACKTIADFYASAPTQLRHGRDPPGPRARAYLTGAVRS